MNLPEPIEVSFDENEYNQNLAVYESRIKHFQNIIDRIKLAVPSIVFGTNDLIPLFSNPADFLASKIITEPTTVGGIELDKTKVFELLSCTDELKQIIAEIEVLNTNQNIEPTIRFFNRYAPNYVLDNSDFVEVHPNTLQDIRKANTTYITTETQQVLYNCAEKLVDVYNEIKTAKAGRHPEYLLNNIIEFAQNESVKINIKEILRY